MVISIITILNCNITTLVAKCQIDSFRLRRTESMCHMFLLNVEFGNSFGFSSITFRPSRVFHSRVFGRHGDDTDEESIGSCPNMPNIQNVVLNSSC